MSLPVWERGLKYLIKKGGNTMKIVAPCVGAWIEILLKRKLDDMGLSLPVWERGLKSAC